MIPGVEPSADPVLQSRLFSVRFRPVRFPRPLLTLLRVQYPDTQRYRLGVNYTQLPINAPINPVANFQRGGAGAFVSQGSRPNYQSSIQPLTYKKAAYTTADHEKFLGAAAVDLSEVTELDFEQPRQLWERIYDDGAKARFVSNVAGHLSGATSKVVKDRTLSVLFVLSLSSSFILALTTFFLTALPSTLISEHESPRPSDPSQSPRSRFVSSFPFFLSSLTFSARSGQARLRGYPICGQHHRIINHALIG